MGSSSSPPNGAATLRVNIGCGSSPTHGWTNFDNSLTVRLARIPGAIAVLSRLRVLDPSQRRFAEVVEASGIRWANAVRHIPLEDNSARALYSSHMLEHLDAIEARAFLREVRRVLMPAGILRLAVPDLAGLAEQYRASGDADAFLRATLLTQLRPRGILARARTMLLGNRLHLWMYDGPSLRKTVADAGFESVRVMAAGSTLLPDPGELDLSERYDESVYVEARKPEH